MRRSTVRDNYASVLKKLKGESWKLLQFKCMRMCFLKLSSSETVLEFVMFVELWRLNHTISQRKCVKICEITIIEWIFLMSFQNMTFSVEATLPNTAGKISIEQNHIIFYLYILNNMSFSMLSWQVFQPVLSKPLKWIQNTAARLVFNEPK